MKDNNKKEVIDTSFKYRHRKLIIIIIVFVIVTGISIVMLINQKDFKKKKVNKVKEKQEIVIDNIEKDNKKIEQEFMVDIKGEVNSPGMYSLKAESRVIDAIEKAGGLTDNANTTVINLSKKITDEMVIIIYSNEEVENFKRTKEVEQETIQSCIQKDIDSLINDACINNYNNSSDNFTGKISLNNATKEELMTIPGIGSSKAEEIINYRESNGGFTDIEQLKEIKGIGEAIFAKIKNYITL